MHTHTLLWKNVIIYPKCKWYLVVLLSNQFVVKHLQNPTKDHAYIQIAHKKIQMIHHLISNDSHEIHLKRLD